jgi:hypothetical protein
VVDQVSQKLGRKDDGGGESLSSKIGQEIVNRKGKLNLAKKRFELGAYKVEKDGRVRYRTMVNPAVKAFRGRKADYLELGYDDFRINRIIQAHNIIQAACKSLLDSNKLVVSDGGPKDEEVGIKKIHTINTERKAEVTLPSIQPAVSAPWAPKGESLPKAYLGVALHKLMREIERLMSAVFVASSYRQGCQETRLDVHGESRMVLLEGVPGTTIGSNDDMEAYADLRALIRQMAPTKDRPGESVLDYRCRWLMREAGMAAYTNSISAILEMVKTALRDLEWLASEFGQIRPMVSDIKSFVDLASLSLESALGAGGYETEEERGRNPVKVHPLLEVELKRVESYLAPAALADFKSRSMMAFRMVRGSLPSPRPRSKEEEKVMGPRFSRPDPVVSLVESITQMREIEDDLAELARSWVRGVVEVSGTTAEMLSGHVEQVCRDIEQFLGDTSPKLRPKVKAGFDLLISDLVSELPWHLGDALAAWLVAHPSRGVSDATSPVSNELAAQRYVSAEVDKEPIPWERILGSALGEVMRLDATIHDTHLHGPGPLGGILMLRYAGSVAGKGIAEVLVRNPDPSVTSMVEGRLRVLLGAALEHMTAQVMSAWKQGRESNGVKPVSSFEQKVRHAWTESQRIMRDVAQCYATGSITNMQEDLERITNQAKELAGARNASVGVWGAPEWQESLLFSAKPYRSFWRGVKSGKTTPLASLATFDPTWSTVFWKRLLVALQSVPMSAGENSLPGWEDLASLATKVADYHQGAVDAFSFYVAPNAGFKCDGPFTFNPCYLPGLAITNVASTFTKAVFGAMNKGGKSDPFWENAGNALVTNLLNATNLLYGYTTFPILSRLIADKAGMKQVIQRLEEKRAKKELRSDQLLDVQNILNWYYGQWETPGADKGETKVNIISTLSVVTQAFLEPGYQIAFAPQRLADISFPGWEWIFKHGKVVAVNLPVEKHSGVTPVVLALVNKSFQKYAQMRDQARVQNELLLSENPATPRGRLKIREVEAARETVIAKVKERLEWQEALMDWDQSLSGGLPSESREGLLTRMLPGRASIGHDNERVSETIRTLLFNRAVVRDSGMAFCLGILGEGLSKVRRRDIERVGLSLSAMGAFRAGLLLNKVLSMHNLPWPKYVWSDGRPLQMGEIRAHGWPDKGPEAMAVRSFLEAANQAMDLLAKQGHREVLDVAALAGGADGFRALFEKLPVALILPRKVMFHPTVQERLSQEKAALAAELTDRRAAGQSGGARGVGLSLIAKVRDLTREIREVEDELEMMPNTSRYVAWCVDEAHFYLEGEADAQYASVSRSARMVNMIATQGPSSIYSRMEQNVADALLINFPNRIVLRQADAEEAEVCANLLGGKARMEVVDRNMSQNFKALHGGAEGGRGDAGGGSVSYSVKEEERFIVEPNLLTNLPAFHAVAVSWDGFTMQPPRKIWIKPDFLYIDKRIRRYDPEDPPKFSAKIPSCYPKGTDLYGLTALRMLQLGIFGTRAKKKEK